jgi:hypothetical protein
MSNMSTDTSRFLISTHIKGVRSFAAIDVDWKDVVDASTLIFPSYLAAETFMRDNPECFVGCSVYSLADVPELFRA